jgi:hypothetical protein
MTTVPLGSASILAVVLLVLAAPVHAVQGILEPPGIEMSFRLVTDHPSALVPGGYLSMDSLDLSAGGASDHATGDAFESAALGLALGVTGAFVGGALGAAISSGEGFDDIAPAAGGLVAGEVLLLPLGVHLGNGSRGDYALDLIASIAGAGLVVGAVAETERAGALWAFPIVQLIPCVLVERHARAPE